MRLTDASLLAEQLDRNDIRFVLPEDTEFPDALRRQSDVPFALFVRGAPLRDGLRVGVVGTRRMTAYGKRVTDIIVSELARHGSTIVSGLALGIDGAAHISCLDAAGTTLAVLPGGVDDASLVPRQHVRLAHRILEQGGSLISEHAPGTNVHPFHFLHRNRIIAALSDAVVVTEADRDSGAMVTARLALECGREVLAVPGSLLSPASRGTNELIKHGARPCTSADDVFTAIGLQRPEQAKLISDARALIPMTPEEEHTLHALTEPRTIDEVARIINQSIAATNALISMLELKGRVISVGPRTFLKVT